MLKVSGGSPIRATILGLEVIVYWSPPIQVNFHSQNWVGFRAWGYIPEPQKYVERWAPAPFQASMQPTFGVLDSGLFIMGSTSTPPFIPP